MKTRKLLVIPLIALFAAGCTSVKTLQATGGSRADGVVELSYEYGMFETPQVQWEQGLVTARERCQAWGYSNAEAFGGTTSACQAFNGYGNCVRALVTAKYQCIGEQKK
ncbi:YecR family lipoprotein [Plesiomonas shigelloides]|uniref:YecR family lipoprotein n=1 Tax=Plesiomonas shigelloides TaxID=703 RepID=UPI00387EF5A8